MECMHTVKSRKSGDGMKRGIRNFGTMLVEEGGQNGFKRDEYVRDEYVNKMCLQKYCGYVELYTHNLWGR